MSKEIIANIEPFETRVAILEDGQLVNLFVERGEPLAGNIYKGRVANVLPGMDAAFIDIGLERNAFLHVGDVRAQRLAGEEVDDDRLALADRAVAGPWCARVLRGRRLPPGRRALHDPRRVTPRRIAIHYSLPHQDRIRLVISDPAAPGRSVGLQGLCNAWVARTFARRQ